MAAPTTRQHNLKCTELRGCFLYECVNSNDHEKKNEKENVLRKHGKIPLWGILGTF
jgi:hypothetical protein